jgi:predicted nucleic acid-binding protein
LRFWDSSALIPLVVRQAGSADVEGWIDEDPEVVVWTLTVVEIVSALRRLVREAALPERAAAAAESTSSAILKRTHVVADVERVKAVAVRLLRVHSLRGADALQLGAALLWADGAPSDLVMHTLDQRLAVAAEREGFRVVPAI